MDNVMKSWVKHCGKSNKIQYNTVKPNFKGSVVLLRFRDCFGFKKAKIKKRKNSVFDISFGSSNRFSLNDFITLSIFCHILSTFCPQLSVDHCDALIKSIEIQLVRVETCGCAEGYAKDGQSSPFSCCFILVSFFLRSKLYKGGRSGWAQF